MLLTRLVAAAVLMGGAVAAQESALDVHRPKADTSDAKAPEGAGHGSVSFQLGFYDHGDSGDGNPFLDESLTVIEPVVVFDYAVTDKLSWGGTTSFDYVSSASIDRLSKFPDQSGASGDTYLGADFHLNYAASDQWTYGGHAGFSFEYDYTSFGLGLNATQALANADASLTYSLDAFVDDIDIIRFDGTDDEGSDSRTSLSGTIGLYQILSPTSHGSFGLTVAQQSGFLETPYNAVVVENPADAPNPNLENLARGTEVTEELPEDRLRVALYGRVRTSINANSAWELGGRFYNDDWGITGITVEPRYYVSVSDALDLRLRYRYYTQTAADDFGEHFLLTAPEFRTQDSDLGEYDAHTLGAKLTWHRSANSALDFSFDFTSRTDGLDHMFAAFGWTWGF